MVLIDALYINNSGGRVLLNYLVKNLETAEKNVFYLLDDRVKGGFDFLPDHRVQYLPGSLIKRHRFYKQHKTKYSSVLCFGNIPPSIRLKVPVYTYFQNTIYFFTSNAFSASHRLQLKLKARVIRWLGRNTTEWWVQTPEVRQMFQQYWGIHPDKVKLYPFFEEKQPDLSAVVARVPQSFLYVSDGHPNKMHNNLLDAFAELSEKFPNASLYVTISNQYPLLLQRIEEMQQQGIRVKNLGWCTKEQLEMQYRENDFLIYPSEIESFGLGLIEAAQFNMKILASDLPYTHAVIQPSLVFDPQQVSSIAACMQQALEQPLPPAKLAIRSALQDLTDRLQ